MFKIIRIVELTELSDLLRLLDELDTVKQSYHEMIITGRVLLSHKIEVNELGHYKVTIYSLDEG